MASIRCPYCGSPAKVRGNRWECGWCGDFGTLSTRHITLTFTVEDLPEDPPPPTFTLEQLEDMVRRWDFEQNEWACRDLLLAAFPDAVSRWTPEEQQDMIPMDILLGVAQHDPDTAIQMVRLLLNTAEEHLKEKEVASQLLGWDLSDLLGSDEMRPLLLEELKWDDRLAGQLFQSAYVGDPQERILEACDQAGETELKARLQELLDNNVYVEK